jgi:hypothetical protein
MREAHDGPDRKGRRGGVRLGGRRMEEGKEGGGSRQAGVSTPKPTGAGGTRTREVW